MKVVYSNGFKVNDFRVSQLLRIQKNSYGTINRASDISRKKEQKFAGFSGGNSRKNRLISREKQAISWIFPGKKSKFVEKSADFAGFSREKSQNSWKNRPTLQDFSAKKVKFPRIFRGKLLEKSADVTGNFGGKLRQETISKKQHISLDFLGEISLKSINFAPI